MIEFAKIREEQRCSSSRSGAKTRYEAKDCPFYDELSDVRLSMVFCETSLPVIRTAISLVDGDFFAIYHLR